MRVALARWLGALAVLACGGSAFAHAALLSSVPAAQAVLPAPPAEVRLMFNEPVTPLVFKLVEPDGAVRALAGVRPLPDGLQVPLPALARHGAYALSWRVISADGHPTGGTLAFSVGTVAAGPVPAELPDPGRAAVIWLARWAWYLGLFFGIGLAACRPLAPAALQHRRAAGLTLLAVGALATLLNLGLLGVDALDLPLAGLLDAPAWRTGAATRFGHSALAAGLALACAALVWAAATHAVRALAAALALALLGTALAASGHASTAPPTWLARPAVWLHVLAAGLWIGALLPLAHTLRQPGEQVLLRRFSRVIPWVLLALVGSGAVLVALQVDTPAALSRTAYGRILLAKLALVAMLLGLGAYNRYRLTDPVLTGAEPARRRLRRVIKAEAVLAAIILAVVALWRLTPPPRALDAQTAAVPAAVSLHMHVHGENVTALATYSAAAGGPATLDLALTGPGDAPLAAEAVRVAFSNPAWGIEPIALAATKTADGAWQVRGIRLPPIGRWDLSIEVLLSDFKRLTLRTRLVLPTSHSAHR